MPPRVEQVRLAEVTPRGGGVMPEGRAIALPADMAKANALNAEGAQMRQAGGALERASNHLGAMAIRIQTENNETAAKEGDTQFNTTIRDTLFDPEKGYFTKQGKDAFENYKSTEEGLRKAQQEAAAKITNPEARKMFNDITTRRLDAAFDSMAKHSALERRKWVDGVSLTRALNAGDDAIAYATDPAKREAFLNVGRNEIISNARDHGEDPEITARKLREYDTKAYVGITQRMMVNDPIGAQKFYDENKHRIDGQQQIGLERTLKEATGRWTAETDADAIMIKPGDTSPASVHKAIVGHESNNRQKNEKGETLTSWKGAKGIGQIMPDTFKRFAKPGESIDNEADNLAVSKRMIDKFMVDYNGDWQRVAVAYFSGEGNVAPMASKKPYKKNETDGGNTVEQYIANVGKKLGKTPGETVEAPTVKTSTDPREVVREIEANFQSYIDEANKITDPARRDAAVNLIRRRKALAEEGFAAQLKVDTENAWKIAVTPGPDGKRPTSQDAIPAGLWVKLDPRMQEALTNQFKHNLKGTQPTTDQSVWYEVQRGLSSDDANVRQEWSKKNLLQYRDKLSDQDFQELAKMQGAALKGDPEGQLTAVRTVNQMIDGALNKLNIDPTPRQNASPNSDAHKAEKFRHAVQQQLTGLEKAQGKKATPEQQQQIIDAMTKEVVTVKRDWWADTTKRRFEVTIDDVPVEEKAKIIDSLTRAGRRISDELIVDLFSRKNAKVAK